MSRSWTAPLLAALALAVACADPASPRTPELAVSNPPPPPVTGRLTGTFSAVDAALSVARIAATGQTFSHQFNTTTTYFQNKTGRNTWLLATGEGKEISQNGGGKTTGKGAITETDADGNLWSIDLTQYTGKTTQLTVNCTYHANCLTLTTPVAATVQLLVGTDADGNPVYRTVTGPAGNLYFVWTP
jgi:hypothetical protein